MGPRLARDPADEPLADAQSCLVDRPGIESLGRAELEAPLVPAQIDGADLGPHAVGDQLRDVVEAFLPVAVLRKRVPQFLEKDPGLVSAQSGHVTRLLHSFQFERIMQRTHGQFHIFPVHEHGNLDLGGGDDLDVHAFAGERGEHPACDAGV